MGQDKSKLQKQISKILILVEMAVSNAFDKFLSTVIFECQTNDHTNQIYCLTNRELGGHRTYLPTHR